MGFFKGKNRSLRVRMNAVMVIVMTGIFSAFAGLTLHQENQRVTAMVEEKKSLLAMAALAAVEKADLRTHLLLLSSPISPEVLQQMTRTFNVAHVIVRDKAGDLVAANQPEHARRFTKSIADGTDGTYARKTVDGEEFLSYSFGVRPGEKAAIVGYVEVAAPLATFYQARTRALATTLGMGFALIILVVVALGLLLGRMVLSPIAHTAQMVEDLAQGQGDLTKRLHVTSNDEIGRLAQGVNLFLDDLHALINRVVEGSRQVAQASDELAAASEQLAKGASEQSQLAQQVAGAVEEMSHTTTEVSKNAGVVASAVDEASKAAGRGGEVVAQTVVGMRRIAETVADVGKTIDALSHRSREIGEIVQVIDEISDQTNLLALNAAIEAARAGEQGRGFAVVADEVRRLAEKTAKATKEITEMIRGIQAEAVGTVSSMGEGQEEVERGVALAESAGGSLREIVETVGRVTGQVGQITVAAEQQREAAQDISSSIERVALVSRDNASGIQQSAQATQTLSRLAAEMQQLVGRFKL
jgi:methyl-accepting chemotaxis protein